MRARVQVFTDKVEKYRPKAMAEETDLEVHGNLLF